MAKICLFLHSFPFTIHLLTYLPTYTSGCCITTTAGPYVVGRLPVALFACVAHPLIYLILHGSTLLIKMCMLTDMEPQTW